MDCVSLEGYSNDVDTDNFRLYNKDLFDVLPTIKDKSVDLFFADLPYNCTDCAWDKNIIDLKLLWDHLKRIAKSDRTPFIFTCTTKFGFQLIQSNPKWYKMDMVWKKRNKTGGLQSRYRPMRNHEMIYFFYKKAPLYNRDTYHKRVKTEFGNKHLKNKEENGKKIRSKVDGSFNNEKLTVNESGLVGKVYEPSNPVSVVEVDEKPRKSKKDRNKNDFVNVYTKENLEKHKKENPGKWEPTHPVSIVEVDEKQYCYKIRNDNSKEDLDKKYPPFSSKHEPLLPTSVIEEEDKSKVTGDFQDNGYTPGYKPRLPTSVVDENYLPGTAHDGTRMFSKKAWKGHPTKMKDADFGSPTWDPKLPLSVQEWKYDDDKAKCWGYSEAPDKLPIGNGPHFNPALPPSVIDWTDFDDSLYECTCELENNDTLPQTVFESKKVFIGKRNHQTEKPVDLMEFFLKYWSNEGDVVIDPTMGSGTMGVACANLNRKFIGCEMNEKIFDVAVNRVKNKK